MTRMGGMIVLGVALLPEWSLSTIIVALHVIALFTIAVTARQVPISMIAAHIIRRRNNNGIAKQILRACW